MEVLTIGGAMIDTIAIIDSQLIERMAMSNAGRSFLLLEQGKKTEASCVSTHCGGGAVNTAVSFSRLGFITSTLIKIGKDSRAELVLDALRTEGVSEKWVTRSESEPTGASAIVSSHDRNAAIFTFRGANTHLTAADLKDDMFTADLIYVAALSGKSANLLPAIVERSVRRKRFLAVNPGIRQISSQIAALGALLPKIDLLAINRDEAKTLLQAAIAELAIDDPRVLRGFAGEALFAEPLPTPLRRHVVMREILAALRALGARAVLLTDGNHGAYALEDNVITYCPAIKTEVMGTAGAGDAFISTFTAYRALGHSVEAALKAASINASSVVQFAEAQTGLLTVQDLQCKAANHENTFITECWQFKAQTSERKLKVKIGKN